jgi:iron complex outermembrane receptor protein
VTATPGNQAAGDLAQSVTVLAGPELERLRASNLGETLEAQLGMSASYFGAGASRPIIRGQAGARVRNMEDSIDSMDISTVSDDHAVGIDPLVAQQVEIFRGPTTLLYGSGAVGGIVNTVTNRIPEAVPEDGFDAALELRGDTAADERTLAMALDGGRDAFAWHVDAADRETGDYEIPGPEPVLHNSDLELSSYSLGGSWLGDSAQFGIAVSGFDTVYGVPGHEDEPDIRIDLEQSRVDLKGGWLGLAGPIETVNLRVGANDYQHSELEGDELAVIFENDAWEGRLELLHAPLGRWSGAFGLQLSDRDFTAGGGAEDPFVPPVQSSNHGLFLLERFETDSWDLELGARHEHGRHEPTGAATVDERASSVSAAAIRRFGSGYSLALNVASAERLPVAEELFANGPHHASEAIEIGNPFLRNEGALHLDLGIRKSMGELTWSITAFVTEYEDFIYLRDTGVVDPDELLSIFEFTQMDAEFSGVEAEIFTPIAQPGNGEIDLRLFTDFVRAELDSGENVPRIPPLRYGARLAWHAESVAIGLEATRYDEQTDISPLETPTAGYTLVSADLSWSIGGGERNDLRFFVRGTNLLDEEARRHSSFVKDLAPLPGRNYSVGLRTKF